MPRNPYKRKYKIYTSKKNLSEVMRNKQVKAVVREELRRNTEKKFHDNQFEVFPDNGATATNSLVRLSSVAIGTSDSTRIGDKLKPVSISVSYFARSIVAGLFGDSLIRVILFQWHPDSGRDPPSVNEILMGTRVGTENMPLSPMNHDGRQQFSILAQKTIKICGAGDNRFQAGRMYSKKLKGIEFRAGGLEGLDHIYLLVVSNQDVAAAERPNIVVDTRLNYTDS